MNEGNREGQLESAVNRKPIIVEIGPAGQYGSGTPASHFSRRVRDNIDQGALYIGVDSKEEDLKKFMQSQTLEYDVQQALVGDMAHLPLADESADEVWLINVFGNLDIRPEVTADGTRTWRINMQQFYRELARVLKRQGEIIIGELGHPVGGIGATDYLKNVDFEQFGLEKHLYIGENLVEACKKLGITEKLREIIKEGRHSDNLEPFFILLNKR